MIHAILFWSLRVLKFWLRKTPMAQWKEMPGGRWRRNNCVIDHFSHTPSRRQLSFPCNRKQLHTTVIGSTRWKASLSMPSESTGNWSTSWLLRHVQLEAIYLWDTDLKINSYEWTKGIKLNTKHGTEVYNGTVIYLKQITVCYTWQCDCGKMSKAVI